jgi:hypothetical protein
VVGVEHKTWTTVDKAEWGPGPWQHEPDKEQWADEATGYACLLKRGPSGALCGYVGVPEGHPWHGSGYWPGSGLEDGQELSPALKLLEDVEVHGGLTYASLCQEGPEGETICHVPAPGEPEPLWWFGFDCAHAWDLCPRHDFRVALDSVYRTADYVKAECAALAKQAAAAAG